MRNLVACCGCRNIIFLAERFEKDTSFRVIIYVSIAETKDLGYLFPKDMYYREIIRGQLNVRMRRLWTEHMDVVRLYAYG